MKILVVEDSATMRKILAYELEAGEYEIAYAIDGFDALESIKNGLCPDLITVDIGLPKMDGFTLCKQLRSPEYAQYFSKHANNHVPVVFVTGNDNIEDRQKGFELGALDFISKPFDNGSILAVINSILKPEKAVEGAHIIIADDSKTVLQLTSDILQREGFHVTTANDGQECYDILSKKPDRYELIITDMMMPRLTGEELSKKIRNELKLKELPIILFTTHSSTADLLRLFKLGAVDYINKPFVKEEFVARVSAQVLKNRYQRRLHKMVDELKDLNGQIARSQQSLNLILDNAPFGVIVIDEQRRIKLINKSMFTQMGQPPKETLIDRPITEIDIIFSEEKIFSNDLSNEEIELKFKGNSQSTPTLVSSTSLLLHEKHVRLLSFLDVSERKTLENELMQARKLEAVGQLSAGIAHELNTPIQFIRDNLNFIQDSFNELSQINSLFADLITQSKAGQIDKELITKIETSIESADCEYLYEEVPLAAEQSLTGINKMAQIIAAMKDFSSSSESTQQKTNVNSAIESTVTVSSGNWKQYAKIDLDLDPNIPEIPVFVSELNQVILNLITNSTHAIQEKNQGQDAVLGEINISTKSNENYVEISVRDNGNGISEEIRDRIFEPFFTTKSVDKGTGQGLTTAYEVVTNMHNGNIDFKSEVGKGTWFIIRLPVTQPESADNRIHAESL